MHNISIHELPVQAAGSITEIPIKLFQALYGEYPWMAVILGKDSEYIASGVLIDRSHILTVAHKFKEFTYVLKYG